MDGKGGRGCYGESQVQVRNDRDSAVLGLAQNVDCSSPLGLAGTGLCPRAPCLRSTVFPSFPMSKANANANTNANAHLMLSAGLRWLLVIASLLDALAIPRLPRPHHTTG